jgi:hypothetical protein
VGGAADSSCCEKLRLGETGGRKKKRESLPAVFLTVFEIADNGFLHLFKSCPPSRPSFWRFILGSCEESSSDSLFPAD